MEKENRTVPSDDTRDERMDASRGKVWIVSTNESRCDHPSEELRHIGDDGRNVYYRCEHCEATLISETELFIRASLIR